MGKYLSAMAGLIENKHLYTVDMDTWEFLEWDIEKDTYSILTELMPNEYKMCIIQRIIKYDNSFFFLQRNTKQIIEFNKATGVVKRYGTEYGIYGNDSLCCCDAFVMDDNLIILPFYFLDEVVVFDLKKKKYVNVFRMNELFNVKQTFELSGRILSYYIIEETIWFCIEKTNMVFCFDFHVRNGQYYFLDSSNTLGCLYGNEDNIFCTDLNKPIFYKYDKTKNMFVKIVPNHSEQDDIRRYLFVTFYGENYIALTDGENRLDLIQRENFECTAIELQNDINSIYEMRRIFQKFSKNFILEGNKFYALPFSGDSMLEVDLKKLDIKVHHLKVNGRDAIHSLQGKASAREYYDYGIKALLDTIEYNGKNECYEVGNNGERIYRNTK